MFEKIEEKISVLGAYIKGEFIPKKFKWRGKEYTIEKITLVSNIRDGSVKKRLYGVTSSTNLYRLSFNRDDESWLLEEIWCEG